MEFFRIIILISTVGNVFGGGESKCGTLQNDITGLLQAFESIINGVVSLVNSKIFDDQSNFKC